MISAVLTFCGREGLMAEKIEDRRENEQGRDVGNRAAWERPALRRLAANDAEMGGTLNADNPGSNS
jgi:hypothetical protein